jgi:FKBP-type peptidyl-prolyl cis-trans isomerase FklB
MRKFGPPLAVLVFLGFGFASFATSNELDFSDEAVQVNYSVGYQIGEDFKRQGVELDSDAIVRGIADAVVGTTPRMGRDEMNVTLISLKRRIVENAQTQEAQQAERMRRAGLAFLEQNRLQDGVQVSESGLQYRVVKEGNGASPEPGDQVKVHYDGRLISGQVFESSRKRGEPVTLAFDQLIPGWRQGLQLMREGAIYELYVPPTLAYDREGPMANQTLIFTVELLEIASADKP